MNKTSLQMVTAMWLTLLVLAPAVVRAQTCAAEIDRGTVASGERIQLTISVSGEGRGYNLPSPPEIEGVRVFNGRTSRNSSWINGKTSFTVTASYYLQVNRDTDFIIPAVDMDVGGRIISTRPIPVTVITGGARTVGAQAPTVSRREDRGRETAAGDAADREFFITLDIDCDEAWVGQQLILTFRFYKRRDVRVWNQPTYTPPRTEGFWRENLPPHPRYLRTVNGRVWEVTEFSYAIVPIRSGPLTIEPAEVRIEKNVFDFFSRGGGNRAPSLLRTRSLHVEVKALPRPFPADFSGVVASQLDLQVDVNRRNIPRGEPVELQVILTANAFLKTLDKLPLPETEGLRMHDSRSDLSMDPSPDSCTSRFVLEKVLIPLEEGSFTLEPVSLVYFDPVAGEYTCETTAPITLKVGASDLPVIGDDTGTLRGEIERLGRDLAFIHQVPVKVRRAGQPLVHRLWWVLLLALPPVALLSFRFWLVGIRRDWADPLGVRRRRALAVAGRRLRRYGQVDGEVAAGLVARTITGYVADRSGRSRGAVGVIEVRQWSERSGCSEIGDRLAEILIAGDVERFADRAGGGSRQIVSVTEVMKLLRRLEKAETKAVDVTTRTLIWSICALVVAASPGFLLPSGAVAQSGPDPARLLAEGNQAYTAGDIETALTKYTGAVEAGAGDPVLFFNLGNARARQGEFGLAIVNYLRAERLAPRDRDVANNLAWLRSHTADIALASADLPPVLHQLVAAVRFFSLDEWSLVLLALVWAMCALVGLAWYRGSVSLQLRRALLSVAALLLVALLVNGWFIWEQEIRRQAVVIVDEVEVRSGPGEKFPVVFRVHDGLTLDIRGVRDSWVRIGLGGEWVGWLLADSLVETRTRGMRSTGDQGR